MSGAVVRFGVLGPLTLERAGAPVALPSGRPRHLLALLLSAGGRPLSRDRLIDELWGERPTPTAISGLHGHMSKVRSAVGDLLVLGPAGYFLRPGDFELDSSRFDELIQGARERASSDNAAARQLLAKALALVRGEPLADIPAEGAVGRWRRGLEEKHRQALMLRIDLELEAGGAGELLAEIEAMLAGHPFEERAWIQLITALDRAGRPAEALDAYQRVRRLFATELGIEPGAQLSRLQAQILDRDQTARGPASAPLPTLGTAPEARRESTLPRPPGQLIGRESELAELARLLERPGARLISLVGPGGVGKTRLLLEAAIAAESAFGSGAAFVALERLEDPNLVMREIAASLSSRAGSEAIEVDALIDYLARDELLLVLDNFEQLIGAAGAIGELLSRAPRVRVLVSSRTPLRIRAEEVFEVEPLALPVSEDRTAVLQSPAVRLFMERLRAATSRRRPEGHPAQVDDISVQLAAAVCASVDGLPLGIELAAARSGSLGLQAVAAQISHPLALGENALRDLPDRQRTLARTLRWSYDLLSPEAQTVLKGAGAFIGGFTAQALAAAVGRDEVNAELAELLDASFARRVSGPGNRCELLPLVRLFAAQELAESATVEQTVFRNHGRYYATLLEPVSAALDAGESLNEIAAPVEPDHANLEVALERAIDRGDGETAVALALGMRPLWFVSIRHQEAQDLIDRILATFEVPAASELLLLRAASFLDGFSGKPYTWTRRLADRARALGDADASMIAVTNLFSEAVIRRDREQMRRLRPDLEALIEVGGSERALGWAHCSLALDAYVEGLFDQSSRHARTSAGYATAVGLGYLAAVAAATELLASSARDGAIPRDQLLDVVELAEPSGVQQLTMFILWFVGRYAVGVGSDSALRWLAHADRIQAAIGVDLWPEVVLRDETLAALGLDEMPDLSLESFQNDEASALSEARAWLQSRDPSESSPRPGVSRLED